MADVPTPRIRTTGEDSLLLQLGSMAGNNASYNVTIMDLSEIDSNESKVIVFGNSNVYLLTLANPDPCHVYNITFELLYFEKCKSGNVTSLLASFDGSMCLHISIQMG